MNELPEKLIIDPIDTICDALENVTQSVRTRKTGEKQTSDAHKGLPSDKQFKYPNESKDWYYKYEQVTADHRFDCDSLREAPDAIDLIVAGLVSDIIIDDQKNGRALSIEAFDKKYKATDGVTVNALDALKKSVKEVNPETVRKQTARLPAEQQKALALELMKKHNITLDDLQ